MLSAQPEWLEGLDGLGLVILYIACIVFVLSVSRWYAMSDDRCNNVHN